MVGGTGGTSTATIAPSTSPVGTVLSVGGAVGSSACATVLANPHVKVATAATVTTEARHARLLIPPFAARLAMCITLRKGSFQGQVVAAHFRLDFVKPDRFLSPPATFRSIVTAERGIDASRAAHDYRPASGPGT